MYKSANKSISIANYISLLSTIFLLSNCSGGVSDYDIICDTDLTEETETLYFEGDYGDIETYFNFEIYKHQYKVEISFDQEIIDSYKNAVRTLSYYIGETPPSSEEFYNVFLNDDQDLYLLQGILETLRSRTIGTNYDIVQMIVGFVQTIPYDKYAADVNYPYETLAFNKGDCDEKSILLCKLLNLEGYNSCLFIYEKEQHMAVGLKVADEGYYKNGYVFIESTTTWPIGKKGKSSDGKESSEEPLIIYPRENDEGYYEQFLDIEDCYKEIAAIHGETYLLNNIKGKRLLENINSAKSTLDSSNLIIRDYNSRLNDFKSKIDSLNKFMDDKFGIKKYPSGKLPSEIYADYEIKNNEINSIIKIYKDLYSEYERKFKSHQKIISKFNKQINEFNKMNYEEKSPNTRTILDLEP
jgi:hypothetical protein